MRQFRHVAHAVGSGDEFDEATEVLDRDDLAVVDRAKLDLRTERLDFGTRLGGLLAVGACDEHGSILFDVDLGARALLDATDHLAAWSDQLADLLGVDLDGDDARCELGDVAAWFSDDSFHLPDDVDASLAGDFKDRGDFLDRETAGLQVKLNAGDALAGAADLEVHLAEEVFFADDVDHVANLAL